MLWWCEGVEIGNWTAYICWWLRVKGITNLEHILCHEINKNLLNNS